jgi:hypothetical protein
MQQTPRSIIHLEPNSSVDAVPGPIRVMARPFRSSSSREPWASPRRWETAMYAAAATYVLANRRDPAGRLIDERIH